MQAHGAQTIWRRFGDSALAAARRGALQGLCLRRLILSIAHPHSSVEVFLEVLRPHFHTAWAPPPPFPPRCPPPRALASLPALQAPRSARYGRAGWCVGGGAGRRCARCCSGSSASSTSTTGSQPRHPPLAQRRPPLPSGAVFARSPAWPRCGSVFKSVRVRGGERLSRRAARVRRATAAAGPPWSRASRGGAPAKACHARGRRSRVPSGRVRERPVDERGGSGPRGRTMCDYGEAVCLVWRTRCDYGEVVCCVEDEV